MTQAQKPPPWSQVLLQKCTVSHLLNKVLAISDFRNFITVFTKSSHPSLLWARWIKFTPSNIFWTSLLTFSSHSRVGLLAAFLFQVSTKFLHAFLSSPLRDTSHSFHSPDVIIIISFSKEAPHYAVSPATCYFLPLGSKYSSKHVVSDTLNICWIPYRWNYWMHCILK